MANVTGMTLESREGDQRPRSFTVAYTPTGALVLSGSLRDRSLGPVAYRATLAQEPAVDFGFALRNHTKVDESWDFDDVKGG